MFSRYGNNFRVLQRHIHTRSQIMFICEPIHLVFVASIFWLHCNRFSDASKGSYVFSSCVSCKIVHTIVRDRLDHGDKNSISTSTYRIFVAHRSDREGTCKTGTKNAVMFRFEIRLMCGCKSQRTKNANGLTARCRAHVDTNNNCNNNDAVNANNNNIVITVNVVDNNFNNINNKCIRYPARRMPAADVEGVPPKVLSQEGIV